MVVLLFWFFSFFVSFLLLLLSSVYLPCCVSCGTPEKADRSSRGSTDTRSPTDTLGPRSTHTQPQELYDHETEKPTAREELFTIPVGTTVF